jgi:hypothetical protein
MTRSTGNISQILEENGWISTISSNEICYTNNSQDQTLFFNVISSINPYYFISFTRDIDNTLILKLRPREELYLQ